LPGIAITSKSENVLSEKEIFDLGMKTYEEQKYNQSIVHWNYLASTFPKNPVYHFNKGNILFVQKKYKESIKAYKKVLLLKSNLDQAAALFIAKSHANLGHMIQARTILKGILRGEKLKASIKKMAREEMMNLGEKQNALEKEKKKDIPIEFPIGLKFFKQQRYKSALVNLEIASETYKTAELYLIKGISYLKLKLYKKSKADLLKAAKLADDPELIHNANVLLALVEKQFKKKEKKEEFVNGSNWILNFDFSINYESNPINFANTKKQNKSSQYSIFTEAGRKIFTSKYANMQFVYQNSFDQSFSTTDDRFVEHVLYPRLQTFYKGHSVTFSPKYIIQESGKEPYIKKNSYGVRYSKSIYKNLRLGLQYVGTVSEGQSEDLAFLDGNTQLQKITLGVGSDKFDLSFNFIRTIDDFNDNADSTLSNEGLGQSLNLYFYPSNKFTISTALNRLDKTYSKEIGTDFIRKEKNTSLSVGFTYQYNKTWSYYFNSNLSFEESNLNTLEEFEGTSASEDVFDFDEQVSIGLNITIF
jgi:tetratricopeptide (TPR) repeat protein